MPAAFCAIALEQKWPIMLPFGILLIAIAFGPVIAQHHWERHYHKLCVLLAAVVCLYDFLAADRAMRVVHAGFDYVAFMIVIGSFFVVSGGIHLRIREGGSAIGNALFLLFGAALANLIGTIGASLLLIRPWIAMNRSRIAPLHVVFFIFLVSNVGGALLPVGPPLLLGFLKGVPFWWTLQYRWREWAITVGLVLSIFIVLDHINLVTSRKTTARKKNWQSGSAMARRTSFSCLPSWQR